MVYLGDFKADQTINFAWNTNAANGASITRSVDGTISVYKDNSDGSSFDVTQVTTGVTDAEDFDSITGVHTCCITTTDAWYETGHDYIVVLTAATIDAQTVNSVIAHFSIDNRSAAPTAVDNAIAVWDRILTGATHNIPTSAGRRVREIGAYAIDSGTAQAGDSHSITIAAGASPSDPLYNGIFNRNLIILVDNTGVGQTRTIVDYDAVTKKCMVDRDWRISPDATTEYQITPDDTPLTVDHGVARGGTNRTIRIRDYAASDDDAYLCNIVTIIAGAGRGQARLVDSYDGTTKVITICGDDWVVTPDTTSIYVMMPYGVACAACMGSEALDEIADCVWDDDLTTRSTLNSAGWFIQKIKSIVSFIRIKIL